MFYERDHPVAVRVIKPVMSTSISSSPARLPLNCIDRVYLIPETTTLTGTFFPMSITRTLFLKNSLDQAAVVQALIALDTRFPQLRLGYRLNVDALRLEKVEPVQRHAHFEQMVRCVEVGDLTEFLGQQAAQNIDPLQLPLQFMLAGSQLSVKMFHVFGDDAFLSQVLRLFLFALLKPDQLQQLPDLDPRFWSPVYRVIWAQPQQAAQVLGRFTRTVAQKVFRYRREVQQAQPVADTPELAPIVSGSTMGVVLATLSADALTRLNTLRKGLPTSQKISLNTLLQVEIARRLQRLGYVGESVCYSIPFDLHRYLKQENAFYPGNLSTQLRVTLTETEQVKSCEQLQAAIQRMSEQYEPLVGLPFEWVMNLLPRRVYDNLHRSWMLNAMSSSARFFVLTNLGSFDQFYREFSADIQPEMYLTVPIMDTPLVISFNTHQGQGNFCATFDPRVLPADHVRAVLEFERLPLEVEKS